MIGLAKVPNQTLQLATSEAAVIALILYQHVDFRNLRSFFRGFRIATLKLCDKGADRAPCTAPGSPRRGSALCGRGAALRPWAGSEMPLNGAWFRGV